MFKLSWLPYILILAGILVAVDGDPSALILSLIGGVWLFIKYSKKPGSSRSHTASTGTGAAPKQVSTPRPPVSPAKPAAGSEKPAAEPDKPAAKFCRHCGAKVEPGDVYCIECGEKL